jgi:hypothetical protein
MRICSGGGGSGLFDKTTYIQGLDAVFWVLESVFVIVIVIVAFNIVLVLVLVCVFGGGQPFAEFGLGRFPGLELHLLLCELLLLFFPLESGLLLSLGQCPALFDFLLGFVGGVCVLCIGLFLLLGFALQTLERLLLLDVQVEVGRLCGGLVVTVVVVVGLAVELTLALARVFVEHILSSLVRGRVELCALGGLALFGGLLLLLLPLCLQRRSAGGSAAGSRGQHTLVMDSSVP